MNLFNFGKLVKQYVIMVNQQYVSAEKKLTDSKLSALVLDDLENAYIVMNEISNIHGSAIIYDLINHESIAVVMK